MLNLSKTKTAAIIAGCAVSLLSTAALSKNLKFADSFPVTHPISIDGDVYWMDKITEKTNGDITFTYFPAEQIAKAGSILQKIKDGVIDVGYVGIGYETSTLPLNNGTQLPGVTSDVVADTAGYWKLISDDTTLLGKEFADNGVVPIWGAMMAPYQIATTTDPIETMEDFNGMKLRTTGSLNLMVSNLGADPVNMSATDTYLAMQRGTVDGTTHTFLSLKAYKISELLKSATDNANFGTFGLSAVMSKKVYDGLTDEQKQILHDVGTETSMHLADVMSEIESKNMAELKEAGVVIYSLSPEVQQGLSSQFEKTQQDWIDRMDKQGLDGAA